MIRAIVRWATAHAKLVIALYGAFVIGAAVVSRTLKFDALPDITTNQVIVLTRAPGLTPEEVERRVARPIESVLGGLPGLTQHRSISRYGISAVTAIFADAVDPYRARQVVQERLNNLSGVLPEGVVPELGPLTGGLGEIFHFTLSSEARSPTELLELAQYKVAPLVRGVQGVVEVNTWGGQRRTLDVIADPIRLAQRGLTLDALKAALDAGDGERRGRQRASRRWDTDTLARDGLPTRRIRPRHGGRRHWRAGGEARPGGRRRGGPSRCAPPDRGGNREWRRRDGLPHGPDAPRRERPRRDDRHPRPDAGRSGRAAARRPPGHRLRPQRPRSQHAADGRQEPARGRPPRRRRSAAHPGEPPRRPARGGRHSAVDAGRDGRHGHARHPRQPDEPRRHRLRPRRGRRGRGDRAAIPQSPGLAGRSRRPSGSGSGRSPSPWRRRCSSPCW